MAITLPDGAYWQPGETEGLNEQGERTRTITCKGKSYNALASVLHGLVKGDEIVSDWYLVSAVLTRGNGNTGSIAFTCVPAYLYIEEGQQAAQKALKEVWTLKSVRNDMSILAYCGPSDSNAKREHLEAWMKEPDGELAALYKWTKPDGEVAELSEPDIKVAKKIEAGIDSVMRFYPMLIKTRTYTSPPATIYENLSTINTPTVGNANTSAKIEKPGNLTTIINSHSWLKCQDDCSLLADGNYQRIESWMGVKTSEETGGWDTNLYGTSDRWTIPVS